MRIVRPIVRTVDQVPQRIRDLQRLQTVSQVLVRHGLGMLVSGLHVPGFPRIVADDQATTPDRAVAALRELGPTFVKLGQVLSTRPDVLPDDYCEAFATLQDDAGPLPLERVQQVLDEELGSDWRREVRSFEERPLATASIAQVHAAVLDDGREVVFKVQRPGLDRVIRADLNILQFLAQRAVVEFPELEAVDPEGALREFEASILAELDFTQEARNQQRLAGFFEGDPRLRVPAIVDAHSTRRVLCMERLRGVKITEAREAGHDMQVVGERALGVVYDMLFDHGFFHADAHPGNVLVLPGDVIGLLDFGMVGRLTSQMRNDVILILFALQRGDYRSIARLFYDIAIKTRRVDYAQIERDAVEVMERHWAGQKMGDLAIGPFVMDLARRAARQGARIPADYTMFFKALMTVEGLARRLLPEIDPIAAATPHVERMIRERLDLGRLQDDALYHLLTASSLLRRLPNSLSQLLDDLDGQRLRLEVREVMDPEAEHGRDRRQNRLVAAVIAVGAALSGTLALFAELAWPLGIPLVTVVFYLVAATAGAATLGMVVWNRG
ncbi:MAG: AarF/ABC1/UbiB kinase family protein [Alphaproteobacteria bacterium]|nr:AarF/ABC1/UbiB kinase family protein [Alphaproteobacteria bacterium]